jgi:pyruvate dehydrogenase E1 component
LQRLDGPVRGNGKIIQELEGIFRGAGWNVIKVIWGSSGTTLLSADTSGLLVKRMDEAVDGDLPKIHRRTRQLHPPPFLRQISGAAAAGGSFDRRQIDALVRGGHDPAKSMPPTRPRSNTRAADGHPGQDGQRATAWAKRAKAATFRISRKR